MPNHFEQNYQARLDGLRGSMLAMRQSGPLATIDQIAALHPLDDAKFDELSQSLYREFRDMKEFGYADAVAGLLEARNARDDPSLHEEVAHKLLSEAVDRVRDPAFIENHGVRYLPDTSPELAKLLRID